MRHGDRQWRTSCRGCSDTWPTTSRRPECTDSIRPLTFRGLSFDRQIAPALRRLAAADPPFVTGINVAQVDYPVVITGLTERGREAAEAAGDPRDASPGGVASTRFPLPWPRTEESFRWRCRSQANSATTCMRVASALTSRGIVSFYDEDHRISSWGINQAEELRRVYMDDSSAVVMFVSSDYAAKSWAVYERWAALSRAIRERQEYVLPVRFRRDRAAGARTPT